MAESKGILRWIGRIVGLVLVVAAVVSVFLIDWKTEPPEEPPLIRPLKTIVIESPFASLVRELPGKVKANRRVDLSFEVPGLVIDILVKKGERVQESQLLARLDPRDYQNDLDSANAELDRALAHRDRIQVAVEKNAVAKQSLTDTIAAFEIAQAKVRTRQKAFDDTYLRAKFPGIIANRFVENFENVQAKQPILSLQDISSVEVEVNIPEAFVALAKRKNIAIAEREDLGKFFATFDYLPGRKFDVAVKEFATEADPKTQTYAATFIMPSPDDVYILPGMTATIHALLKGSKEDALPGYALPVGAVPVDGQGNYYVWKVEKDSGEIYAVRRASVSVGEMMEGVIQVLEGVAPGDRIATAGVHFLQEGQRVRLLEAPPENEAL